MVNKYKYLFCLDDSKKGKILVSEVVQVIALLIILLIMILALQKATLGG